MKKSLKKLILCIIAMFLALCLTACSIEISIGGDEHSQGGESEPYQEEPLDNPEDSPSGESEEQGSGGSGNQGGSGGSQEDQDSGSEEGSEGSDNDGGSGSDSGSGSQESGSKSQSGITQRNSTVSSEEELLQEFNTMLLCLETEGEFKLSFKPSSIDELVQYLVNNGVAMAGYELKAQLKGSDLTLQLEYDDIATKKSDTVLYTQMPSFNLRGYANSRSADYDDFPADKRETTMTVANSDALVYALENGFKPVIPAGNTALSNLYQSMKNALKICVSDSMSDMEKALAIYEYLIAETTYDGYIAELTMQGATGLSAYNSFYLEGVFNDHLAVCDGIAKAYSALCNLEGIQCVRVTGVTINGVNHAWNKINIGGAWYVVDATAGGTIVNSSEIFTYSYFMITDEQYKSYATEDGKLHPGLDAVTAFDIYDNIKVSVNGTVLTLCAKTPEEAGMLFACFAENCTESQTSFDFKLGYEYTDVSTALADILESARYYGGVSYVEGKRNNLMVVVNK